MTDEKKTAPKRMSGKKRGVDKWKKKAWYTIFTPEEFGKKEIAQTVCEKPEMIIGRTLSTSAAHVANQPRLGPVGLKFRIVNVQGQKALTKLQGFAIQEGYLKRLVRRRSSKIELVTDVITKDHLKARVKIVTVSAQRITERQRMAIRKLMATEIEKAAKARAFRILAQELIFGQIASTIGKRAKKIVGIKRVDVVKCQLSQEKNE